MSRAPFGSLLNSARPAGSPRKRESVPIYTVHRVTCRGCGATLAKGQDCELIPARRGTFHCSIKALTDTLLVTPHEDEYNVRKITRLSCATCQRHVGVGMLVKPGQPRSLLKAKDVTVVADGKATRLDAWTSLPEARAARGDADAALLVANACAKALAASWGDLNDVVQDPPRSSNDAPVLVDVQLQVDGQRGPSPLLRSWTGLLGCIGFSAWFSPSTA